MALMDTYNEKLTDAERAAFERAYGDDLTNDAPINGGDAVDLLGQVATLIRQGAGGAA